jgi:hypothetical protein
LAFFSQYPWESNRGKRFWFDNPPPELLIEDVVRVADGAGCQHAGKRKLASGNLLHFVLRELTCAHPDEHSVIVVVRHKFLLSSRLDSFSKQRWGNPLSKQNMDQQSLQNKPFQFNVVFVLQIPKRNGSN